MNFQRAILHRSPLLIILLFFPIRFASAGETAETSKDLKMPSACETARIQFCKEETDPKSITACLGRHRAEIGDACKQELSRIFEERKGAAAVGGGAMSAFGGPNASMGPPLPLLSYEGRSLPGNHDVTRVTENKFNISMPVYHGDGDSIALSIGGGQTRLGDTITLDSGYVVPNDLDRIEFGMQYSASLEAQRRWGLRASIGYAGDKPFHASQDDTYSLMLNYGVPSSERGYWMLMLMMSNNSPLLNYIPIPGAVFFYRGSNWMGMFGFPISSVQWTPVDPWVFSFSLFGPTIQTEAGYGHLDQAQFFVGYQLNQQSYIPSERANEKDRLTLQEQRANLGVRFPVIKTMQLELQAGRSFDRSIYLGNGFQNKDGGSAALQPDWFGAGSVKLLF